MLQSMKRNRTHLILTAFVCLLCLSVLDGCTKKDKKKSNYTGSYIYCLDSNETKIEGEKYTIKSKNTDKMIHELLHKMRKEPETVSLKNALSDSITLDDYTLTNSGELSLYWTASYTNYTGPSEVLRRAAIVKTLCQVPDVKNVQFYVAGQPLTDSNMNTIGFMTADTFVDNTGDMEYTQNTTLNMYFASVSGTSLVEVPVKITYDASIPLEQLALKQLIKGPSSVGGISNTRMQATIPSGTKVNKISVKDNTCYLDLSSDFLDKRDNISDEVTIYSVVNTLVELSNINKVQFSIDGEQVLLYNDSINFGEPFERNLDLVLK